MSCDLTHSFREKIKCRLLIWVYVSHIASIAKPENSAEKQNYVPTAFVNRILKISTNIIANWQYIKNITTSRSSCVFLFKGGLIWENEIITLNEGEKLYDYLNRKSMK